MFIVLLIIVLLYAYEYYVNLVYELYFNLVEIV